MIKNAHSHINNLGTPLTNDSGDIYFSNDDGLTQSHYVYYEQNNIDVRLQNHDQLHFVIAETSFGTGLNFLNTWQRFTDHLERMQVQNECEKNVKRLHFISFEQSPLTVNDLKQALTAWPTLGHLSEQLAANYPINLEGCHRLEFNNGSVVLDLYFGECA